MTTATDPMTDPAPAPQASAPEHAVPEYSAPAPQAPPASGYAAAPAGPGADLEQRGFAVSSLVLGLVSIVAGFTFVVPVAGLVLGILALKREPSARTMAIWGIVLNAVMLAGLLIAGLFAAAFGLFLLPFVPLAFV
ncbi:MAG TPA: DUF4190 domain-containing protein [Agromyces sp.]